jgi:chorismate synthase
VKLRFLTAGESHGKALVGILEGLPSQLPVTAEDIQVQLRRRKLGYGRGSRQKMEDDAVQILSGVRHGLTMGSPIALLIENKDWKNWTEIMQPEPFSGDVKKKLEVPRPGHADYLGGLKYQHEDMRNVLERASARETTMRVAVGSVARKFLKDLGIQINSRVTQIGALADTSQVPVEELATLNDKVDQTGLRVYDTQIDQKMMALMDETKLKGDTLGGIFEVYATGLPLALGSYSQWDRRLEGDISKALMSLNAIKGIEVGLGFELGRSLGSQAHDEFAPSTKPGRLTYQSNRSGGIDGGMTTGQPLVVRAAMKPIATLMQPLQSVRLSTNEAEKAHVERSDVCAAPAAAVIAEAILCLVLADAVLDKFGGDSLAEVKERLDAWRKYT